MCLKMKMTPVPCARPPHPGVSAELMATFYPLLANLVLEAALREEGDEGEPGAAGLAALSHARGPRLSGVHARLRCAGLDHIASMPRPAPPSLSPRAPMHNCRAGRPLHPRPRAGAGRRGGGAQGDAGLCAGAPRGGGPRHRAPRAARAGGCLWGGSDSKRGGSINDQAVVVIIRINRLVLAVVSAESR